MKALYYPHTHIRSELILKNALLLWDSVETIVPSRDWKPSDLPDDRRFREAYELVVAHRVPTTTERRQAHEEIEAMAEGGVLMRLASEHFDLWREKRMLMYPEKFLAETWYQLERGRLADCDQYDAHFAVHPGVGLMMMSVMADACAGTQIHRITDRGDAYSFVSSKCAQSLGAQRVTGFDPLEITPSYDRLAEISTRVLDAREIPLENLLALRKREASDGGSDLRRLRQKYHKCLQQHIERIGKEAKSETDRTELEHQFRNEVADDLADLKSELRIAKFDTLMSKDVLVPTVLVAGLAAVPAVAAAGLSNIGWAGVIPLANGIRKLREKQTEIMRKHQMSWLYLAKQKPKRSFSARGARE